MSRWFSSLWSWRGTRWLTAALLLAYFAFGLLVLVLRYAVLPQIGHYRGDLEGALSRGLGLPVSIARVEADWQGLRPRLILSGLEIRDRENRPALSFDRVQAVLGWTSLLVLEPRLHRLEIQSPELAVRRDPAGQIFVAGLRIDTSSKEPGIADWVLDQHQIVVSDAAITWSDELRGAPTLSLARLNLNLVNSVGRHRFGLSAQPPADMAGPIDLRGDLTGRRLADLADWRGQLYAALDGADLAVWRTWVDYPVELPRGKGSLRLWLDVAGTQPAAATADLSLGDVAVRLGKDLPMLTLTRLQGRLQAKRLADGLDVASRGLVLDTADGIHIDPLDLHLRWQPLSGELQANHLDFERLVRLADHLPLPEAVRERLARHEPRGRFVDLNLAWSGRQQPFEHYRAAGRFENLGWVGEGEIPGASGLTGSVDGNEQGGRFELAARDAVLDLPAVFDQSRIPLERLDAQGRWKRSGADYTVSLERAAFRNADAQGSASGSLTRQADHAPVIDLDARLERGEGNAVWKYMPKSVNPDVAAWLKAGIVSGHAENVGLKLKGDLSRFPFTDGSGQFRIQGRILDAVLNYAPGWPRIDGVEGELLFDKARMLISARKATLMGTVLGPVTAELSDLMASEETIVIQGKAKGELPAFLRFIEASPVGDRIDHATAGMSGGGPGELDLKLVMPLRHVADTKVAGSFRFDGDRMLLEPGVPVFDDLRGRLEFTGEGIAAKDLRARGLGGAMSIDIRTQADGMIAVDARGEATAAGLRQYMPASPVSSLAPLFGYVSGSSRWDGTVRIRKRNAEIRIASDLKGLSVGLPEPFNKAATESRPFVFESKSPDPRLFPARSRNANRELLDVSLGRALKVQLLRNRDGAGGVERGFIGVNVPVPRLPERGTLLAVSGTKVDGDFWRRLLLPKSGADAAGRDDGGDAPFDQIDLRADEALVFGRTVHDLRLQGNLRGGHWQGDVRSREVTGRYDWLGTGKGKLTARISQFTLPESTDADAVAGKDDDTDELPALDLGFDRFVWGSKDFGQVKLTAENRNGYWNTSFNVQNDDLTLSGEGRWKPSHDAADTAIDFKLNVKSIERFLGRIGYVNAVKRGSGTMEGKLEWNGPPHAIDYPTLSGNLKFSAKDGQFNKMDPGVGRLLGIVSLQSLPRRITLDFRDVFSEGFAFDAIDGTAKIQRGVLETKDLEIKGPAALVAMQGNVDLARETQDLRVRVQPALGESVTTGLVLAHPAVGAAYWVANKLFGRPLDQIFAFEYAVSGAWTDPKVEKVGGGAPKKDAAKEAAP